MHMERIQTFRKLVTLKDGARVLFRVLVPSDKDSFLVFFRAPTIREMAYIRSNVRDEGLVASWALEPDHDHVLPIIAVVQNRIVGVSSLHFKPGPHAHVAELRIVLAKDYRRRGLGIQMMETMFDLARWRDIHMLEAQIVSNQTRVVKAFKKLGFEERGILEDYFMTPERETRDVTVLTKRLIAPTDEF